MCLNSATLSYYTQDMITKNKTEQIHERLILQAKKLALVELQVKIAEEVEKINNELICIDTEEEDSIPF